MRDLQVRRERSPFFFDDMWDDVDQVFNSVFAPALRRGANLVPPYELQENEQGYLLSFDLPGVPKDEIQIEIKDQQLKIAGERRRQEEKTEGARTVSERRYGRFERLFTLPSDVDGDRISAHHEDGVLHLMLPKTEKVKAKQIKIETGAANGFFSRLVGKKDENPKVQ